MVEGSSGRDFLLDLVRVLCSFLSTRILGSKHNILVELQGLCTRKILIRNVIFSQLFAAYQSCPPPTLIRLDALFSLHAFISLIQLANFHPGILL